MQIVPATSPGLTEQQELEQRIQRFQLARVLQVTERMLMHAQAGQWSEVEELELLRSREMANSCCMLDEMSSEALAGVMATLLHLNEQLVDIVRHAREQLLSEQGGHNRVMQAVRAYIGEGV